MHTRDHKTCCMCSANIYWVKKSVRWQKNVRETLLYIITWTTLPLNPTSGKHHSLAPPAHQYSTTVSVTTTIPVQLTACLPSIGRQATQLFNCINFYGSIWSLWSRSLAGEVTRPHAPSLLLMGAYEGHGLLTNITGRIKTLEAKHGIQQRR